MRITAVNEKTLDLWKKMSETGMSEKYGSVMLGLGYVTWLRTNNMDFLYPLHSRGKGAFPKMEGVSLGPIWT